MAKTLLLEPEGVIERLRIRFRNQRSAWLRGEGDWPLRLPLGIPTEKQALTHLPQVKAWSDLWANWRGPGSVSWSERRWPSLGTQTMPEVLTLHTADEVAQLINEGEAWARALDRFQRVVARWPQLSETATASYPVLSDWRDEDFQRLNNLLVWLTTHPASNLYIRQLPVPGIDTKWLEKRQSVVISWLSQLIGLTGKSDLYALAGLRRLPQFLRMRVLDPELRKLFFGLGDIQAPVEELAKLDIPVRHVFIVENLQTGLAFEDMAGAVVLMGQGYSVEPFGSLPWLRGANCYFWGDLDTHGFAILDRLRRYLPKTHSILMDEATLMRHRELWVSEETPVSVTELPGLYDEERTVFEGMLTGRWGNNIRLEQERIEWAFVQSVIGLAIQRVSARDVFDGSIVES
jgi:hypothetical protein